MAQSSITAGLGFLTTVGTRVNEGMKRAGLVAQMDELSEEVVRDESDQFVRRLICRFQPEPGGEVLHLTSSFASAAEAFDAGKYERRWGYADRPGEIPLILQPVDENVRLVPLPRNMTNLEVLENYPRIVTPASLLTLGFRFPNVQREKLVLTVWRTGSGPLWDACLDVDGGRRRVSVDPDRPDDVWSGGHCVLVRE